MFEAIFGGFNDTVCVFPTFSPLRMTPLGPWMKELPLRKTGEVLAGTKLPFNKTPEELNEILAFPICCMYTGSMWLGRLRLATLSEEPESGWGDKSSWPLLDSSSVLGLPSDSLQRGGKPRHSKGQRDDVLHSAICLEIQPLTPLKSVFKESRAGSLWFCLSYETFQQIRTIQRMWEDKLSCADHFYQ